ncbi:MAG: ABC transporter permease, partial [Fidelibacterota bacterium]
MISTYLRITFRTMLKHKGFSSINIFGLALSISICLMIIIFIKDQKSSDRFHEKRDRIVRVYTTDKRIEHPEVKGWATTPGSLAPYLLDNAPSVEEVIRVRRMGASVLKTETAMAISGMYAEPSFFRIF